jgi:outer membrane protein assembly factor BamB
MVRRLSLSLLTLVTWTLVARADDWPQWMGPERDGVSKEKGLLKDWPKGGPKLKWKLTNLGGESYSAPAVVGGRIYLLTQADSQEYVTALDEKDGTKVWSQKLGKVGANPSGNNYAGPRGTPTVDGDCLFALGSAGDLVCMELTKGDTVWHKNLASDFGGKPGNWAYAESPLVDGDLVIVSPGGSGATVLALKKKDGTVGWKAAVPGGDTAAYGSPIRADVGGVKQYVVFLKKGLVGVSAEGKYLWRYAGPANRQGINIPTPVFHDGIVFGASGYGQGGGAAKLTAAGDKVTAEQVWFSDELVSQIGGFIRVGDHLYGAGSGAKGAAQLLCVEFATGKIVWRDKCVGAAELCAVDGMLYVRGQGDGTVALVEANPAGYKEHGRLKQPDRSKKPAWPYPVVANGCLYLRDMGALLCYDVRDPNAGK